MAIRRPRLVQRTKTRDLVASVASFVERTMTMGEAAQPPWISYAAYLEIERASGRRHEWLDGQVYGKPSIGRVFIPPCARG